MTQNRSVSARSKSTIARLATPPGIETLSPVSARFVYSLRLIALHERVRRDPVPELASRLCSVDIAARSLALSQAVTSSWPENILVSRFCCGLLTHDEATIARMIDAGADANYRDFETEIAGLVRPDRFHLLWESVLALIAAEMRNI